MNPSITNVLITGASGIGKSTLLRHLAERAGSERVRGFVSESIWDGPDRVGWRIDAIDGRDGGVLAHREMRSSRRMGAYGVDVPLFERVALAQLPPIDPGVVYLVDEIGHVSTWSPAVTEALQALLAATAVMVAIVRERDDGASPLAKEAKNRADSKVLVVTQENRGALVEELARYLEG